MASSAPPDAPDEGATRELLTEPGAFPPDARRLFPLARREICVFDESWSAPLYESADWHAWLGHWLAEPGRTLRVVLRDMEFADHYGERLKLQLRRFPTKVAVHCAEGDGLSRNETLLIADKMHYIRRGDSRQPRGVLVCHDPVSTEPIHDLFEAIWQQSVVALTATTLGI